MCILTGDVKDVSATKIFVGLVGPREQMTIYSNKISLDGTSEPFMPGFDEKSLWWMNDFAEMRTGPSGYKQGHFPSNNFSSMQESYRGSVNPVAMILPIPLPRNSRTGVVSDHSDIRMVDVSKCETLFDDLDAVFPQNHYGTRSFAQTLSVQSKNSIESLAVKRSGSYRYSVVPSLSDFDKLRKDVFNVDVSHVKNLLSDHYKKQFAFLVCIIDKSAVYSPIAYIHPSNGRFLFVPTLHKHGDDDHVDSQTSDWDHSIYSIDRALDDKFSDKRLLDVPVANAFSKPFITGLPHSHKIDWNHLKKRSIKGTHPNADIILKI